MQKNNIDEWNETGWYPFRTVSISNFVSSATFWEKKEKIIKFILMECTFYKYRWKKRQEVWKKEHMICIYLFCWYFFRQYFWRCKHLTTSFIFQNITLKKEKKCVTQNYNIKTFFKLLFKIKLLLNKSDYIHLNKWSSSNHKVQKFYDITIW